jgi:voltage-gated potassium channel
MYERLSLWHAIALIVLAASTLVVSAAVFMRIAEPAQFPSMGTSFWWAVVTVGTVGYGDVVPESAAGRVVASAVILFGMAWIPLIASLVVAALITRMGEARADEEARRQARIEERLERIEQLLARRPR